MKANQGSMRSFFWIKETKICIKSEGLGVAN